MNADDIIKHLGLEPLPGEGGWYRETYRAPGRISVAELPHHDGDRCHSTQIYFLLKAGEVSALHRVKSDEVFHHYAGAAVKQLQLFEDGSSKVVLIGNDIANGERPQVVVPAGVWQGAMLDAPGHETTAPGWGSFALLGCTVAPGFEWDDFELVTHEIAADLSLRWPEHEGIIRRLSPSERPLC